MKINYLITVLILLLIGIGKASSQELIYEPIQNKLTEDQRNDLEKSAKAVERTNSYITKAEGIEKRFAKFKNSKKKRKKKKYEKKTWEAKKLRVNTIKIKQKSYERAISVYSEFLQTANFYYPEDKVQVDKLLETCSEKMDAASDIVRPLAGLKSKGDFKKKINYSKLSGEISKVNKLHEEGYENLTNAIDIYLEQENKKLKEEADEKSWQMALQINTIQGYENYIAAHRNGKYKIEAQNKISELKEKEKNKFAQKENDWGYIFSVQIAASRIKISPRKLKKLYSDPSQIKESYSDNFYKYRIGQYSKYEDAYEFKSKILLNKPIKKGYEKPFIVVFDKDGNQLEVTESMKPEHLQGMD